MIDCYEKLWIARDKSGELCLFTNYPPEWDTETESWVNIEHSEWVCLNDELFPELKYTDGYKEVELKLK